jgi:hypothetical protein
VGATATAAAASGTSTSWPRASARAHLAADVKAGKLTQAQADEMLANCKARISDFLNGKAPAGGPGGPGHGGPGGQGGAPASGSGTSGTSGTTTS